MIYKFCSSYENSFLYRGSGYADGYLHQGIFLNGDCIAVGYRPEEYHYLEKT